MNEKEQATKVAEETKTNEVVNEVANASTVQGRDAVIKALKTNPNNFVQVVTIQGLTIEERQGLKIGAIEEAAYRMGFIDANQLKALAEPLLKSGYGKHLMSLI